MHTNTDMSLGISVCISAQQKYTHQTTVTFHLRGNLNFYGYH